MNAARERQRSMSENSNSASRSLSALVGSSSRINGGRSVIRALANALAISTSCRCG
jgi:hypothetical protein